jgi:hypothetical protein
MAHMNLIILTVGGGFDLMIEQVLQTTKDVENHLIGRGRRFRLSKLESKYLQSFFLTPGSS